MMKEIVNGGFWRPRDEVWWTCFVLFVALLEFVNSVNVSH